MKAELITSQELLRVLCVNKCTQSSNFESGTKSHDLALLFK